MSSSWVICLQTRAKFFQFSQAGHQKVFSYLFKMICFKVHFVFSTTLLFGAPKNYFFKLEYVLNMIDMSYPTIQCTYGGIPGSQAQRLSSIPFISTFHPSPCNFKGLSCTSSRNVMERGTAICRVCHVYMNSFEGDWYILLFQCPGQNWQLNYEDLTTRATVFNS